MRAAIADRARQNEAFLPAKDEPRKTAAMRRPSLPVPRRGNDAEAH
jgi:hypothetical protein